MKLKELTKKELQEAPFTVKFVVKKGEQYPNIMKECSIKYPEYFEI